MPATASPTLRDVRATRYVTPLREGGSMPALVEGDDDGLYVVKLRGAGQGVKALIAEVLVGELARALGLRVPEIVLVDLDPELAAAEPDPEIQELVQASGGRNAALDFLPGALPFNPAAPAGVDPELAAAIVWLDALTTNVDRTPRNPNMLLWHGDLWLIDHGAALYRHHAPSWPRGAAAAPFPQIADHALLPLAAPIPEVDAQLAARLPEETLRAVAATIPDEWLREAAGEGGGRRAAEVAGDAPADDDRAPGAESVEDARRAYVDVLAARLADPRAFVAEAEEARRAA